MWKYYNRYNQFLINGVQTTVPFVKIPKKPTDRVYIYKIGISRLDKISYEYYNSPYFGWLILQANPQFGGLENNINDGAVLTVPFPLESSLLDYKSELDNHFYFYGR